MSFYPFNEFDGTDTERGLGYNLQDMRFVDRLELFAWTGDRSYIECKIQKRILLYWKKQYETKVKTEKETKKSQCKKFG